VKRTSRNMDHRPDDQFRTVLRVATEQLRTCLSDAPAGSGETPYLDAMVLLGHAASMTTEQLFAAFEDEIPEATLATYQRLIADRCKGTPVSYLRGVKEFFGRDFEVGPGVLVPRPDTEVLVETAIEELDLSGSGDLHLHDCCTGSGCVAITIGCERTCVVTASDISEEALAYARRNCAALDAPNIAFWQGDLLDPLRRMIANGRINRPEIITANPPYVADNEVEDLTERGWPEPSVALDGGEDGLAIVRRLVDAAAGCLADGGQLMVEIGADQGGRTAALFEASGYVEVSLIRDLGSRDRVCRGKWYKR
jgi:release factor glutamine methyltransferase